MKRGSSPSNPFLFFILFMCFAYSLCAQQQKKLSAQEIQQWNGEAEDENILDKISPTEKSKATEHARALLAYTVKAVLHEVDAATYPVDENENSPQKNIRSLISKLSPYTLHKMKSKALALLSDPSKRAMRLGKLKDIDFKRRSIDNDIKTITPVKYNPVMKAKNSNDQDIQLLQSTQSLFSSVINPLEMTKMDFVLRAIHCVDETDPESGDDDIVMGGMKVSCGGHCAAAESVISCHFDDGVYCDHGSDPLGGYNLNSCPGYPKTVYFIIQLVEVDSDERDAAKALSDIMKVSANALEGSGYDQALAYISSALEVLSGWLFDDDAFHPYGIALTLNGPGDFGADGRSNNRRTKNISDHGGAYRVGYYWQKRN